MTHFSLTGTTYMHALVRFFGDGKQLLKGRFLILLAGFVSSLFMMGLAAQDPLFFQFLNNKLFDTFLRQVHSPVTSGVPVIVDLDEKSLAEFGQWPWPRYRVARLVEKIAALGADAVGLDVVFAEPDRTSLEVLQRELAEGYRVKLNVTGIPADLLDNDRIFAKALAAGPFVLGYYFKFESLGATLAKQCDIRMRQPGLLWPPGSKNNNVQRIVYDAPEVVCNIPILSNAVPTSGFFNTLPDADGIFRRTPLFIAFNGKLYPSLALATLLRAKEYKQYVLRVSDDIFEPMTLILDDLAIPLDEHGQFLINFRGPRNSFPYYSAADLLKDKLPANSFKGKIVFLGTSAAGLKDLRATPLDQIYPGVEAHATVVDNILRKDFIQQPAWYKHVEIFGVLAMGFLSTLLLTWTKAVWSLVPLLLCGFGFWQGAIWSLENGRFLSPLYPLLTLVGNFSLLTLIKFWREESEKRFFHSAFSRYVSKAVVDQIVKSPEKLSLGGEEREVSILFSDIRGFTSLSEQLSPNQVSELLHAYFTPMTKQIIETNGTMDKFIGDAIMAFWNAPLDTPGHQGRAVKSALAMLDALATLNLDFATRFELELHIGIGLHCGSVRVGNMGSADLFDYTIIGDNVNLASRLEGLTKYYGLECLVSENIKEACDGEFYFQEVDKVRVKGKKLPISIYAPHRHADLPRRQVELDSYQEALDLYKNREFEAASEGFAALRETSDKKHYAVYQERCVALALNPPGPEWDQVFTHLEK